MNIALIHPSRGRAQQAIDTARKWLNKQSGKHTVNHILIIDSDDPQISEYKHLWKEFNETHKNTTFTISQDPREHNVVFATNYGAQLTVNHHDSEMLIYLSDDFNEPPPSWDEVLHNQVWNRPPGDKWLIKVHDGIQDINKPVLTIPIMSRGLYLERGCFWHKEYLSMWVDVDLHFECEQYIIKCPNIKIQHYHPTMCGSTKPMDATYTRSSANWNQGAEIFNRRKRQFNWQWEDARMV